MNQFAHQRTLPDETTLEPLRPNADVLTSTLWFDVSTEPRRIVGVVADLDDENVVPGPAVTVYHPLGQAFGGGRLFVHASTDPYTLVTPITRIIRELSADQPVGAVGDA